MVGDFGHLFKQARWYTKAGRADSSIKWIVLHVMQAPEKLSTAEGTQNYFASTSVKASTHFSCDADSTVQSVMIADVAYGAGGANAAGVHIEQAGYSEQSAADWSDEYSQRMLVEQVAPLVGRLAARLQIPLRFVDAAGLKRGDRGVTTHKQCSDAFGGSHWDPGLAYPMGQVLDVARLWVAGTSTTAPPAPGPSTPTPLPVFPDAKGNEMILQRNGQLWIFWSTADGRLLHKFFDGQSWSGQYQLVSGVAPLAQVQATWLGEQWHVFAARGDGRCAHAWWTGRDVGSEAL
jgi:hypothetical protein